jgi:Domain of unknown function (DUF4126)
MDNPYMIVLSIAIGISLAAACGLRVFLPLFITSIFSHFNLVGFIGLNSGFGWIGEWPAMMAFGAATVLELISYYIPFVDHALDVIAVPLSTVAGTLVAMSTFTVLPPHVAWSLALIAGGGIAGLVSAGTATARVASTATTGGLGNPVVATAETGGAITLSLLAWFIPLVAIVLVLVLLWLVVRWLLKARRSLRA